MILPKTYQWPEKGLTITIMPNDWALSDHLRCFHTLPSTAFLKPLYTIGDLKRNKIVTFFFT